MGLTLENLDLDNFGKFEELSVQFDRGVNYLVGMNGTGKSTILNAIWATMQGMGERGRNIFHSERFRYIGENGKSAKSEIVLYDDQLETKIIIKNRMDTNGNNIEFFAEDGVLPEDFVDSSWNTFCVDPEQFARLDPKEQAVELGIDTTKFDDEIAVLKADRRDVKRDLKKQESIVEGFEEQGVEETEPVNLTELLEEKQAIERHNEDQQWLMDATNPDELGKFLRSVTVKSEADTTDLSLSENIQIDDSGFFDAETKYENLGWKDQRNVLAWLLDWLPEPDDRKDVADVQMKIANAQEINNQAETWKQYQQAVSERDALQEQVDEMNAEIEQLEQEKAEYVGEQNLPFKNMSIDEEGGLLLNDRPLQEPYFSQGEIWAAITRILAKTDPDMKFFFVRNASNLDEKKRKTIEALAKDGYQPIFEIVGESEVGGGRSILLSAGE